jgi:dephospho-CoA kinase
VVASIVPGYGVAGWVARHDRIASVLLIGLTGGIGSGKTTVAGLLAERGAAVVDADAITRRVQQPGTPVFDTIVAEFGPEVVAADGTLDRRRLAGLVFDDPDRRRRLERIVHPAVVEESRRQIEALGATHPVVVYDVPLLVEATRGGFDAVVVVDVDPEVAVARVVASGRLGEADARARVAHQASREERRAVADRVVDNSGTLDDLRRHVDELWTWIEAQERRRRDG